MKYLYLFISLCFVLPDLGLNAQEIIPVRRPLENYRTIIKAHTENLVRFAELEWRCLEDLEDACDCNSVFSSIVDNANRTNVINLEELSTSFRRCYPGIRFTAGMNRGDVLTIMANERLIKLRESNIFAFDNGHDLVEANWYEGALDVMNLDLADKIAVLQSDGHLLGEVISASGLKDTVIVVNNNPKITEILFRAAPQVEADFWKLPRYVSSESFKLPEGEEPNKVVLLDILKDYYKPTKTLRQLDNRLYPNDEVIVVQAIGTPDSPFNYLTPKECDKLLTKRNYKLLESRTQNGYYLARYRFDPPENKKIHFSWKPQRTRISRTGSQR